MVKLLLALSALLFASTAFADVVPDSSVLEPVPSNLDVGIAIATIALLLGAGLVLLVAGARRGTTGATLGVVALLACASPAYAQTVPVVGGPGWLPFLTHLAPLVGGLAGLALDPRVKPLWTSLPGRWPMVVGGVVGLAQGTCTALLGGDDIATAIGKGVTAGILALGIGHVGISLVGSPTAPVAAKALAASEPLKVTVTGEPKA